MIYISFVISAIVSYLVGGFNAAIFMAQLLHHEDIREKGSHNPGFTNYKRVYGNGWATWFVLLLDLLKTILPVLTSSLILHHFFTGTWQLAAASAGLFVMLGHCYPLWYGFHGGKAFVACFATTWIVDWRIGLIYLIVFLCLLMTLKYMSVSSCTAALSYPLSYLIVSQWNGSFSWFIWIITMVSALLVVFRHWPNFIRLMHGEESKFHLHSSHS